MTQNKRIVITGGIATGKSTASALLREAGYPVIDADVIARGLLDPEEAAYREVVDTFGQNIVQSDGSIDRKKLGAIVFSDAKQRERLNRITHPRVAERIDEELTALQDEPLVFLDIPLYYETEGLPSFPVWLIYIPEDCQLARLMKRDGLSEEQARARMASQMGIEEKRKRAQRIVDNSKDIGALARALQQAVKEERADGE
ncbi:MAG: dephospho-CoA kinase [Tissierellia bacterium]|jgi:dephospho-CoA kinase|nr:dephospho-CoA kinase [Bacillota bacterium]NLK57722.1 dephospho-CoA kinase [Tissierellia bacterium]